MSIGWLTFLLILLLFAIAGVGDWARTYARRKRKQALLRTTNQFFCEQVGLTITNGEEVPDEELTPEQLGIKEEVNRRGFRVARL